MGKLHRDFGVGAADIHPPGIVASDDPASTYGTTPSTGGVQAGQMWIEVAAGDPDDIEAIWIRNDANEDWIAFGATSATIDAAIDAIPVAIQVACSDQTSDLATGTAVATFRMPYALTLTAVRASVATAPTGGNLIVDINEGGTTILSTKITIDVSEKTSTTAATAPVISDSALADDAEITIDIDQVGSTVAGAGLIVTLIGTRT